MQEMQLMSHTSSLFLCIQLSNCVFSCHMHSFSKKFNVFQKTNFVLPAWNGFWYVTVCSNGIVLDSSLAPLLRYVGLARLVQPLCNCYSCIKSQAWRFSCTSVFCLFTVLLFVCISVPSPFCVWWQIQISTCESSFMSPYTNLPIPIIELWRYVEVIKEIDYCDDILSVIRLRCQRSFALANLPLTKVYICCSASFTEKSHKKNALYSLYDRLKQTPPPSTVDYS